MTLTPAPAVTPDLSATLARTELERELALLDAHLRSRHADWTQVLPGRAWSPAQEAEHALLIAEAGARAVRLLLSARPLRPVAHEPGTLVDGQRQSPAFAVPGTEGLTWEALDGRWAAHVADLLSLAAQVRSTPDRVLWHPFLGELDAVGWLRSISAHTRHHREALQRSVPS